LKALALLRIRAHTLSSPSDLVAVIGDENAGRAPANPQMDGAAYASRFPQTTSLEESLAKEATQLRKQAQGTPTGR